MTSRTSQDKRFIGVGVEWADSLEEGIVGHLDRISCVELIPENFFHGAHSSFLRKLRDAGTPTLVHAVELSLGTDEPLKRRHLDQVLRVADQVNAANISDHLCLTEAGGVEVGQLTPLPWTVEAADVVCRKVDQIQAELELPFILENITNRFIVPGAEMAEPDFINSITRRTGCYCLLDLHNVHVNATNFGFDPYEWIDAIDLDSVLAIHLAGGHYDYEGTLLDSHSALAPRRVWDLYRYVCDRIRPACTIVEWTDVTPPIETLLDEVGRAEAILEEAGSPRVDVAGAKEGRP